MKQNSFQLILPVETEFLIPEDDNVRLLDRVTNELDYTKLYRKYKYSGKIEYSPELLFKIVVYGYMNSIYSSRDIEKACRRDINFMWLLRGKKAPDHNTINRFVKKLNGLIEELFYELIKILKRRNEIAYRDIYIDGTKLEANANKYTFVWKKSILKYEKDMQKVMDKTIPEIKKRYSIETVSDESETRIQILKDILYELEKEKAKQGVVFVKGKGKRKTQLQKDYEKFETLKERQKKYDDCNQIFDGRNSFSKTDRDATFMRMKNDHMKNSQLKPGYNVQIGVEGEYIVGIDISPQRSDQLAFIPFMKKLNGNLEQKYKNIVADAGYESEENYDYLISQDQNSFIKPKNYEKSKKSSYSKDIRLRENMYYDSQNDTYTCHNNKKLYYVSDKKRTSDSGYEIKMKVYECESCLGCILKSKCTKAEGNRQIQVSENFIRFREQSLQNITGKYGTHLRINRSVQVEGAFGVLKQNYGFRRFLTRGKLNVQTQFILLAFAYNINKLHNKTISKRTGVTFYHAKAS